MLLFIHVSGDKLMINDSTGLTEPTGKKAPPRKPKITIGKFRKFWITVKLLIASPKNRPNPLIVIDSHSSNNDKAAKFFPTGK